MHAENDEAMKAIQHPTADPIKILSKLEEDSPGRLELLNTESLTKGFRSRDQLHLRVARHFQPLLDLVSIQRSQGSLLQVVDGEPIQVARLSKTIHYSVANVPLDPSEEVEYQMWHRAAAK
jgi:hypothetical protein